MSFLTKARTELLDALLRCDSVAEAAQELGISEGAARQRLFKLKLAYQHARQDLKKYGEYRMKMPSRYL